MEEYKSEFNRILGRTIRDAREKEGLSRLTLALDAGIDSRTLERIENGEQNPSSFTLYKIRRVIPFDISVTYDMIEKEIQNLDLE